jgi:hypothetical protein
LIKDARKTEERRKMRRWAGISRDPVKCGLNYGIKTDLGGMIEHLAHFRGGKISFRNSQNS